MPAADVALKNSSFRTSPRYELVLFDRLGDHERAALADLQAQENFYGILRRRQDDADAAQPQKLHAVDRDTALLLMTMRDAGRLPAYALSGDPSGDGVRRLVLDGFLEISDGSSFVSGRSAASLLLDTSSRVPARHRLAQLSWEAVEYGASLAIDDRSALSMRLYGYNRLPLTSAHAARYRDAAAILDAVVGSDHLAAQRWGVSVSTGGHWINFSRRSRRQRASHAASRGNWKLYVSPRPAAIGEAFPALLDALDAHDVRNFKMAGTAAGLLRPDKLVAYFDDQATLSSVAERIAVRLAGVQAHGVPFTCAIDGDGLLSWGADPPPGARPLSWQPQHSWRSWITEALAGALMDARSEASDGAASPAEFAVRRLEFEGVDVERWAPAPTAWRDAASRAPVMRH